MQKRIWIIGASSGIGLSLVHIWLQDGYRVAVSARNATTSQELLDLKKEYVNSLEMIDVDVTDSASLDDTLQKVWSLWDGLEWAFYNAGAYEVMHFKEWDIKNFELMSEVNYMGAVRFCTLIAQKFKTQGFGRIIMNASLSSYFGLPYGGGYSAPKAAMVNFAQSIQPELLQLGIQTQIINHGFVKTRLTAKNDFPMPGLMSPQEAAANIAKSLEKPYRFEIHFPFALRWFLRFLNMIPNVLALKLTKKAL